MADVILNLLPLTPGEREEFLALAPEAQHCFHPDEVPREERSPVPDEEIERATVILGNLPPERLGKAKALCWLQTYSAGVNPYLEPGAFPAGAALTSAVGCYGPSVAEHTLALCLALCKALPQYRDQQAQGVFRSVPRVKSLWNAQVLVLGTGDLGATFAKLCKGLGAHTTGLRRTVTGPVEGFDRVLPIDRLEECLPGADVVCLMLPHSPETVHIMDEGRIRLMKKDAILLNAGRGPAVHTEGLLAALEAGWLWGVGLDVTDPEPLPPDHPLWAIPRVFITPHSAGGMTRMERTRRNIVELCQENLVAYLGGKPLRNAMK